MSANKYKKNTLGLDLKDGNQYNKVLLGNESETSGTGTNDGTLPGNDTTLKTPNFGDDPKLSVPDFDDNPKLSVPKFGDDPTAPDFNFRNYNATVGGSAAYDKMNTAIKDIEGYRPFEWDNSESYQQRLNDLLNREAFSYDINADELYQQYKDMYQKQGQRAMKDAMGRAAALSGGYGNSYAQSVGQQAYAQSLEGLTDRSMQLYQMAWDRYNQEGQNLLNNLGVLGDDYNRKYGEYGDTYKRLLDKYGIASDTYYKGHELYNQNRQINNDLLQKEFDNDMSILDRNDSNEKWKSEEKNNHNWLVTDRNDKIASTEYDIQKQNEKAAADAEQAEADLYAANTWENTGVIDPETGDVTYVNGNGKRETFGRNVNPHTNSVNPDLKYNDNEKYTNDLITRSYQPTSVLEPDGTRSGLTFPEGGLEYDVQGNRKYEPIFVSDSGNYYVWDDRNNEYVPIPREKYEELWLKQHPGSPLPDKKGSIGTQPRNYVPYNRSEVVNGIH